LKCRWKMTRMILLKEIIMANKISSLESLALTNLKKGQSFISYKRDKDITAISSYYKRKVKTERILIINPRTMRMRRCVQITIT
jgi:hypothetical protein